MEEDNKEVQVAKEYQEAYELFRKIEDECISEKEVIERCKEKFRLVGNIVNSLGVYSSNETHADISTPLLKYLLVPYYLAMLETKLNENRLAHLKLAKLLFANFFQVLEMLSILPPSDKEEAEKESKDAREIRDQKIMRIRNQKELEKKIDFLAKKRSELLKKGEVDLDKDLDEVERDISFSQIHLAANQTFSEIRLIDQEIPLVEHMETLKKEGKTFTPPPPPPSTGRETYTIYRDHKGELRSKVFQPHWIPPSMTIEQAKLIELQNGRLLSNGGPQSEKKNESEGEESDPDDDEAYRQKREYDDWCDAHPRGSGNTLANVS